MKKTLFFTMGALILFLGACSSENKTQPTPETTETEETTEVEEEPDTVVNEVLTTVTFKETKGKNKLEVQYPEKGKPELLDSLRQWINLSLGGTFRGDLDNPQSFFRHYATQLGGDPEMDDDEFEGSESDEITLDYLGDVFVTFRHKYYSDAGGEHGVGGNYGTSFLLSNGSMFSKNSFNNYEKDSKKLHKEFVEGLKRYFKVTTDEQLLACLSGQENVADIPAPNLDPWLTEEGVAFSYTPYEIAPFSAGAPNFVIPAQTVLPLLNSQGKAFLAGFKKNKKE